MKTAILYLILAAVIALAVYGTVRRIRHGSACCGEHEPAPKRIKPKDRDPKNYPLLYDLKVDGMHCANCAVRVENAFNSRSGLWGKADIGQKRVELKSKYKISESECSEILSDAGYTLLSMKNINL